MGYFFNSLLDFCAIPFAVVGIVVAVWLALRLAVWALEKRSDLDYIHETRRAELQQKQLENESRKAELDKQRADLSLVQFDPTMPILDRAGLAGGAYSPAMLAMAMRYLETLQPVANVPNTIHYAPSVEHNYKALPGAATSEQLAALPEPKPVADFWQLYTGGLLPDKGFLMGYSLEDGQAVTATWRDLYSALIGGQSGSGKSTLIRSVLAQSALQGGRFAVLDPHFGAGEESLGASLMPLRGLMMCDVAANERQMLDTVRLFVEIGKRRLHGDPDRTPHILIVDELTSLLSRSGVADELNDLLGMVAQETRKVNIFALCIGQQFHSSFFDTTTRNSFVSYIGCRMRRDVARVMTGSKYFADFCDQLTTGQAVWMTPGGEVHRLAVPNTTQQHIEMIAKTVVPGQFEPVAENRLLPPVASGSVSGSLTGSTDHENDDFEDESEPPTEPGSEPLQAELIVDSNRLALVRQLLATGAGINEIVRDVWQVKHKGRAYQQARSELMDMIQVIAKGGK